MKKIVAGLALMAVLGGCGTVMFDVKKVPAGKTQEQAQLDNLECSNISRVQAPLLFGIGYAISRSMAETRFRECMEARGYQVEAR